MLEQIASSKICFPHQDETPWVEPLIGQYEASSGTKLYFRYWSADRGVGIPVAKNSAAKKPVVIYVHGIEGHSEWFQGTASYLSSAGVDVYAPDRRGAGLNPRLKNYRYGQLLDDLELFVEEVFRLKLGAPIFLLANCWGAKPAIVAFAKKLQLVAKLSGLILTSPAIKTKADLNLLNKAKTALGKFVGLPATIDIPIATPMFTDTKLYLDYINQDTLRLTKVDSSFFAETFFMSFHLLKAAQQIQIPLLLVQSSNDDIVQIQSVKDWFSQVKSKDKVMHVIPNCAHSVDFQIDNSQYWKKLTDFIWHVCDSKMHGESRPC